MAKPLIAIKNREGDKVDPVWDVIRVGYLRTRAAKKKTDWRQSRSGLWADPRGELGYERQPLIENKPSKK